MDATGTPTTKSKKLENQPNISDWQQNFPTYKLGEDEIALAEYQAASERSRDDDNAISISNGLLLAAILPTLPIITPFISVFLQKPALPAERWLNLAIFASAAILVTAVLSAYFCHLRRSYVFSARKVIVLRRMLGQSYGPTTLVLPNWRLEGADNPFAIRLFPGWNIQNCYPYYAIAALTASLAAFGIATSFPTTLVWYFTRPIVLGVRAETATGCIVWIFWFLISLYFLRRNLFDNHESNLFVITRITAKIFRLKLIGGLQTALYEARLARYESIRLGIDLTEMKKFAMLREDNSYCKHNGTSWPAIARAIKVRLSGKKAGGGTTITQQLARTLFIIDLQKTVRRKIIEIMLARWLNRLISKKELIEIYLCSVRYERGVLGVSKALVHFFGKEAKADVGNSIILVERISSVTGRFRREAIAIMLEKLISNGVITVEVAYDVLSRYRILLDKGKILEGLDGYPEDIEQEFRFQFRAYK